MPPMDRPEPRSPELERFWRTDDGLTAAERAEAYGIDLSLLDVNLSLTPAQRLNRNASACSLVESLQKAVKHAGA